jgi:beta-galactosidase
MGRINFGRAIKDFKGITDKVELTTIAADGKEQTTELKGWDVYLFPDSYEFVTAKNYTTLEEAGKPAYYKGTFTVDKKADTFIDLTTWGKGLVWVNGHCLGRFWEIGPQQTLYMPGCWLKKGENEIIILDVKGPQQNKLCGHEEPILDALRNPVPATHREPGTVLSLEGEKPVLKAAFRPGNGWQEQKFSGVVEGQYICIEVLSNQAKSNAQTAIAEWYFLDADGNRLSREPWTIQYADSEDKSRSNRTGDRIYDLQESTYWSTAQGAELPHHLIINLGSKQRITALQYLPRMEEGAPGAIKDYRIYVKDEPFNIVKE